MRVGAIWRGLALFVAAGLLAACTPSSGVSPSPTPTISAPPVSPSPTENAIERQERLDYAAAEKAYRAFRAEYGRVLEAGGATEATKVMKETAGGSYLAELTEVVQAYKQLGYTQRGDEIIDYVRSEGHSDTSVRLVVCVDGTSVRSYAKNGDLLGADDVRRSELRVNRVNGQWRVWTGVGEAVSTC